MELEDMGQAGFDAERCLAVGFSAAGSSQWDRLGGKGKISI
jgi:hypothetical protein